MEDIGLGVRGAARQACLVYLLATLEGFRHPDKERHLLLDVRCQRDRRAVQVEAVLAERLAMIRDIEQGRGDAVQSLQQPDRARHNVIGVEDRVVVGIDE